MNNKITNYAYQAGALKGFLGALPFTAQMHGVDVTDQEAFDKWIQDQVARIVEQSQEEAQQ